jgi:hypothetical protein
MDIVHKLVIRNVIHHRPNPLDSQIVSPNHVLCYRLCGLMVRVLGYRSGGPGSIPGSTRKKR